MQALTTKELFFYRKNKRKEISILLSSTLIQNQEKRCLPLPRGSTWLSPWSSSCLNQQWRGQHLADSVLG